VLEVKGLKLSFRVNLREREGFMTLDLQPRRLAVYVSKELREIAAMLIGTFAI
jgi:hypothetical protein